MVTKHEKDKKKLVEEVQALRSKLARLERVKADQAEQAPPDDTLKQSEQFYRSVIEQAAESIVLHDLEGHFVVVNPAFCESLGYTQNELLKMTIPDIDPNFILDNHPRRYWDSLPLKKTLSFETKHRRRDGTTFPVEVRLRLIEMNGRKHILGSVRDITERKNAEQAVQASERFLACVFDTIQDGISVLDVDLTVRSVNSTMKKRYEANLPLEGRKCYQCYHNKDVPCDPCPTIRCMQSGQTECEIVPGLPGSTTEWVELYSYPIKDSDSGRVTGVVEFVRDITEQKRMEKALQQSEQQYRTMFEQAIDSVVLIDPDTGKIEEFNDKACQNLGYTRQEFGKLKLSDIEAVESPEEIFQHLDKVAKQGMDIFETKHRTKNGEIRNVLVSANIIYARGRKLCQSIFRDITEQKQATEKLNEYQTKLKSMAVTSLLNEEHQRRRIAHGLHDDIGQKLAVAKFDLLSSIRDGTGTDTAESVKNVCSQIDAMIESVRSLTFELSNPVLSELGLEAAIERHLTREIRGKHDIEFQLNKCGLLAQLDEDISMCLFRSVRELLNNVVKHSNAKKVFVSLDKADGNITIRVNDDGVGFDPAAVNSKINAGVGFGLFSIREQLESFAGELKVESSPGHGSSFTINAPLQQRSK